MSKLIELQAELERVQNSMAYITRHGGSKEDANFKELEQKEASILAQMDEVKRQELVDSVTAEFQASDKTFMLSANGFDADFRALAAGEDEYQMLSVTTQLYLAVLESNHRNEIDALKASFHSELKVEQDEKELIKDEMEQLRRDLADVRGKLEVANNLMTDLEMERDNAIKESESKSKQIDDLRQKITEKPTVATNIGGSDELAAIKARLEAKKIPVYNVRQGDLKESFYYAQLAETGEEIEIRPYYELKSKYREVTAEEAARFRSEAEAAAAAIAVLEETQNDHTLVVPPSIVPQFQDSDNAIQEHAVDGEVDEGTTGQTEGRTIEERLAALEVAVFGQTKVAA